MLIENSFDVDADPDRVFDFLRNPHNVASCFPGAELTEDLGDDSYRGKVKIKLGPVTAAFSGIARITELDETTRVAVLVAEGKDARGSGTAKATATMRVEPNETGASVQLSTDLTISGKLAQFGRGIMADVSNRMVGDLAERVRQRIEAEGAPEPATAAATGEAEAPAGSAEAGTAETGSAETAAGAEAASAETGAASVGTTEAPAGAVAAAPTATEATAVPAAETVTAPAGARSSEPAPAPGAIKASTLLRVMVAGIFRRLFARLRGRDAAAPKE